ncbi:MAG: hypothetical protein U0805_13990 [Pirellulales bacterium]
MATNEDMSATLNRLAGGLINAILGALILWVGQTTFRHAGILAGVDEKLNGVQHKFDDVEKRQEETKRWLETVISQMKDCDRLAFTTTDGDKLAGELRQTEQRAMDAERRFIERLSALELKLATLEAQRQDNQELAALKLEVAQLRSEMIRQPVVQASQEAPYQPWQPNERMARGAPVFLPPVDNRR